MISVDCTVTVQDNRYGRQFVSVTCAYHRDGVTRTVHIDYPLFVMVCVLHSLILFRSVRYVLIVNKWCVDYVIDIYVYLLVLHCSHVGAIQG